MFFYIKHPPPPKKKKLQSPSKKKEIYSIPFIGTSSTIISKILESLDPQNYVSLGSHNILYRKFFSKIKDQYSLA